MARFPDCSAIHAFDTHIRQLDRVWNSCIFSIFGGLKTDLAILSDKKSGAAKEEENN